MEFINKLLGRATPFKRNALGDIEVLIHKDARRYTPHGFVVASNKAQKIKRGEVAVVFPDLEDAAPELTYQVMTDLFEAMHAQGWVAHHIVAWGTVREIAAADKPPKNVAESDEGFTTPGFGQPSSIDLDDVPAYLRQPHSMGNALDASLPPSGVLAFARKAQGELTDTTISDPTVLRMVNDAMSHVEHLDPLTANAAKVRFEQIGVNGLATGKSYEYIADKLSVCAMTILSARKRAEGEVAAQS